MTTTSPRVGLMWSAVIAVLVVVASVAGLTDPRVYAEETSNWMAQAQGQDVGNLLAVAVLLVAALGMRRGSARAELVWLGSLLYLVYAFIIYALAVHLNYLFLVYVAVLGLSAWTLIFHVPQFDRQDLGFPSGRVRTLAASVLIAIGVLFAALWLSELVPALVAGTVPASLADAGLWVNPIHVIDLSLVLPGFVLTGVAALRARPYGLCWLAPWLVFSALMGASIVVAMVLLWGSSTASPVPPLVMVALVVLASLLAAWGYLRATTPRPSDH